MSGASEMVSVRLKPYDAARGHVLRSYRCRGVKFTGEHGWCRVAKDLADYLRTVREIPGDPTSPLAFDVSDDSAEPGARETTPARETSEPVTASGVNATPAPGAPTVQAGSAASDEAPDAPAGDACSGGVPVDVPPAAANPEATAARGGVVPTGAASDPADPPPAAPIVFAGDAPPAVAAPTGGPAAATTRPTGPVAPGGPAPRTGAADAVEPPSRAAVATAEQGPALAIDPGKAAAPAGGSRPTIVAPSGAAPIPMTSPLASAITGAAGRFSAGSTPSGGIGAPGRRSRAPPAV